MGYIMTMQSGSNSLLASFALCTSDRVLSHVSGVHVRLDHAQCLESLRTQRTLVGRSAAAANGTAVRRRMLLKLRRGRERLRTPCTPLFVPACLLFTSLRVEGAVRRQRPRGGTPLVSRRRRRYVPFLRRRRSVLVVLPAVVRVVVVAVDEVTFESLGVPEFLPSEGVDA